MKIMMSAGEVSGDLHGERLARAVLEQTPDTELIGFGGARMERAGVELQVPDAALDALSATGYDPVYGARPLRRYLQASVETLIARTILSGDLHAGDTLVVDAENGALVCRVKA